MEVAQIRSLGASEGQKHVFMFPISGFGDIQELFPGTFQDFHITIIWAKNIL